MKLTSPPALPHYLHESFTYSKPIQDAIVARIAAKANKQTAPDLKKAKFTQEQHRFIRLMAKKELGTGELQRLYISTLDEMGQVLSRPEITDDEFDVFAALNQPEIVEAFAKWEYPKPARGFGANPTCSKALMTLMSLGYSTYVRKARTQFAAAQGLQSIFADHENKVAAVAGRNPKPCQQREYTVCLDQIQALSSTGFARTLMETNIEIVKGVIDQYPDGQIGVYAAIDGTDYPAWVKQVGVGATEEEELEIRRRTPNAGARWIKGDNEITVAGDHGELINITQTGGKFWRGYYLVPLVCLKTGMPLVWTIFDANPLDDDERSAKEADAIRELLDLLYELWPDCPLKYVVGDKAWDFSEYYRLCLTQYGVHLVAIQRDDNKERTRPINQADHKNVVEYTGRGEVWCRHHHDPKYGPMTLAGHEFADRDGLAPGDTSDLSKFRVRYRCEHCAKTYSLPTRGIGKHNDWNIFSWLPHSPLHLRRYVFRRALETRRNTIESFFAAVKTVTKLALQGPSRSRLTDFDTIATLLALSFTLRNAQVLAAERIRAEQYPDEFPTHLLGGRKMIS